ncbi:MAG: hypothetical protein FWG63_01005 [Defluviitaleaceae bacterium]|nr:hypothetical protein [Defluviitaleaceae bacterium]
MKFFAFIILVAVLVFGANLPTLGTVSGIDLDGERIINSGPNSLEIVRFTMTSQNLNFAVDLEESRVLNINEMVVEVQKGTWFDEWLDDEGPVQINIPLAETDWSVYSQDGYTVVSVHFGEIATLSTADISLVTISISSDLIVWDGDDWFSTLVIVDEELIDIFDFEPWDPLQGQEFDTTIEMVYFLDFGSLLFQAYASYIAPVNITLAHYDITLEIISSLALEHSWGTEIITFFTLSGEYFNADDIWENTLVFYVPPIMEQTAYDMAEDSPQPTDSNKWANPIYFDEETGVTYFVARHHTQAEQFFLQDDIFGEVSEEKFVYNNFYLLELQRDWNHESLTLDIDLSQLIASHTPGFVVPQGDVNAYFDENGFLQWELFDIDAIGELAQGSLNLEIAPGAYLSNIALEGNVLYVQYWLAEEWDGSVFITMDWNAIEQDINDDMPLIIFPSWILATSSLTASDSSNGSVLNEVYVISPDIVGDLIISTSRSYPTFTLPLNMQANFYTPIIPAVNFVIDTQIYVDVQNQVFALSNFTFPSSVVFDFDIDPWEDFSRLLGEDTDSDDDDIIGWQGMIEDITQYFEMFAHFEDGTREALVPTFSGFSHGFEMEGVDGEITRQPGRIINNIEDIGNILDIVAFEINGVIVEVE